jgi:hypothetical protein
VRSLSLLLSVVLLAGCHPKDTSPTTRGDGVGASSPEAAFWTWFAAHQAEVAKVQHADEPIAEDLARELHKVDDDLVFELGVKAEPRELIISADGIQRVFPAVKRVVAAAPAIPGWRVIAFRPRHGEGFAIALEDGTKLSNDEVSFRVEGSEDGKLDVALYLKSAKAVSKPMQQAMYLQLDSLLGEYDVETKLGGIDIEPGTSVPEDARPLRELPGVVDATK